MSSRNYPSAVVGLAVVSAGLWWAYSSRTQQEQIADTYPQSNQVIEAPDSGLTSSSPLAIEEGGTTVVTSDDAPVVSAPPEPVSWQASAVAFANQDDADPALSRHLEAEMQKLIDATLDRAKYDASPVTCRVHRCQVIAINRVFAPDPNIVDPNNAVASRMNVVTGGSTSSVVPQMLLGASKADILNPSTGVSLKAQLEKVQSVRTEPPAIEFIIAFAGP